MNNHGHRRGAKYEDSWTALKSALMHEGNRRHWLVLEGRNTTVTTRELRIIRLVRDAISGDLGSARLLLNVLKYIHRSGKNTREETIVIKPNAIDWQL
jgi:hypothetical protein